MTVSSLFAVEKLAEVLCLAVLGAGLALAGVLLSATISTDGDLVDVSCLEVSALDAGFSSIDATLLETVVFCGRGLWPSTLLTLLVLRRVGEADVFCFLSPFL